jgi:hypothetical protein
MPFTSVDTLPEVAPAVRIFFSGLMVIKSIENGACEIFVHRSASAHQLTIEVRRKTPRRPDGVMMRHVGPLAFVGSDDDPQNPPIHGLFIEKNTEGSKQVEMYVGNSTGSNGEESFDLAVDMADPKFHNGDRQVEPDLVTGEARNLLDIDPLASRPSIFLNDGIVYAAAMMQPGLILTLKQRGQPDRVLPPFASLIGANLYLKDDESVVLTWRNLGKLEQLTLKKPDADVSYEIYIVNDPLYENDTITDPALDPKHDEFAEYYKIFTAVPTEEQFRLQVQQDPNAPKVEKGSTMVPCMPVTKKP